MCLVMLPLFLPSSHEFASHQICDFNDDLSFMAARNSSLASRRYTEASPTVASGSVTTPDRSRPNGRVSQSQPSSRSASPSSLLNYYNSDQRYRVSRHSGIPQSTSRDTSPNRSLLSNVTVERGRERRISDVVDRSDYLEGVTRHMNNLNISSKRRSSEASDAAKTDLLRVEINNLSSHLNNSNNENNKPNNLQNVINNHKDGLLPNESNEMVPATTDHCLDFLKPVIGELPTNQTAIKMLTKLVEQQPRDVVVDLLPDMMPALVQAYDSPEIAVRKAAVFAMVTVHNAVGEEPLKVYLDKLNGSKMKLLNLYIERSKAQNPQLHSSGCSSPSQTSQSSQ